MVVTYNLEQGIRRGFNEAEARTPRMGGRPKPARCCCARFNEAEARTPRMDAPMGINFKDFAALQ